jgi:hypothetical protein
MKRRGYRHPAHTPEPVASPVSATSPVPAPTPTFTTLESFAEWLESDLQSLEIRFSDFVTRQSTRVAAGISKKSRR